MDSAASVCECGQLRVIGIYRGFKISCPGCGTPPLPPRPFGSGAYVTGESPAVVVPAPDDVTGGKPDGEASTPGHVFSRCKCDDSALPWCDDCIAVFNEDAND